MSSVHDLSEDVDQIFERHLPSRGLLDVSVHDQVTISEIPCAERIHHVPAFRPEPSSLDDGGVEEAQREQDRLDFDVFVFDLFFGEIGPGSLHVGLESGWRLVRELDGSVQDADWDIGGGISGQEEPEVRVPSGVSSEVIKDLLEFS